MNCYNKICKQFSLVGITIMLFLVASCAIKNRSISEKKTENSYKTFYKIDHKGNKYLVANDLINKYNFDNELLFTYSNKSLGAIHTVDVSNPLRPLIFYKEQQILVITDNTLSAHNSQTINFENLGMYQIQMIASSKIDNGIWVYDQATFQLKKLTQTLEVNYQSGNLEQLLGKKEIQPIEMIENNGYLFLVCPNNGILIFDMYGAYYKTLAVLSVDFIYPTDQFVYVVYNQTIEAFHLKSVESALIQLNTPISEIFGFFDNKFYGIDNLNIVSSGFTIP